MGAIFALVFVGFLVSQWIQNRRAPRYLGRTEQEWFPTWSFRGSAWIPLTNEPPEAVPVFLAAMQRRDSPMVDWWNTVVGQLPDIRGVDLHGASAYQIRFNATEWMLRSAARPETAAALMDQYESLPEEVRREILGRAGDAHLPLDVIRNLSPLLVRVIYGRDIGQSVLAGHALMKEPVLARPHAERLITNLAAELRPPEPYGPGAQAYLIRLGDLGSTDPRFLRRLIEVPHVPQTWSQLYQYQLIRSLTLARLDPAHHPVRKFIEDSDDKAERSKRAFVLSLWLGFAFREQRLPHDLAEGMEALLLFDGFDGAPGGGERFKDVYNVLHLVRRVSATKPVSAELQDALTVGIRNSSPFVRRGCGTALAQLVPPSSNVLDHAATLLMEGWEADCMIQVFWNARVLPKSVEPLVRAFAEGRTPEGWTAKPTVTRSQSIGTGLRPASDSLQVLSRDLLRRIEEASSQPGPTPASTSRSR